MWIWVILIGCLIAALPWYVKILSAAAYRGKTEAMKKLFKNNEKEGE